MNHFDELRLPAAHLEHRKDGLFEFEDSGPEHRTAVLRALQRATQDLLVAKYTYRDDVEDPEFLERFVAPLWQDLAACLTRQDLLRWLVDWAQMSVQDPALREIQRLQNDLDTLTGP